MSALHPLFDHHVKHQQQWSSLASVMNDTRARLEKLQHDTQAKLDEMQTQLAAIIEALAMINSSTNTKKESLSDKFEQIGSRRFYIERDEKDTWDNAASKCLLMGGYLASFRNKEELEAILPKLEALEEYWLGINNLHTVACMEDEDEDEDLAVDVDGFIKTNCCEF
ncbi:accessory gland protein Acp29AB-like [Drosophila rhopaloa]|uniref:Accessory gland protein Acp29AB-like n=1 Tax=Drosophila rhopaloa TaxID=1041015 RepID=A0A6P4FGR7_DRORH|nr:accessory gland protein Acp29AB-like [Drosophila rhopaloa]